MKLGEIAHARAGDKGDTVNISVIARSSEHWPRLQKEVSKERVATQLGHIGAEMVTRYELPQLCALNFVIRAALGGGVTRSLAQDAHGKCQAAVLLEMEI